MLKTILIRSLLLFFSLGVLCAPDALGQVTCNLRLTVSDLEDNSSISGASATAKRSKALRRAYSNKKGVAYFSRLPIGRYAITVSKKGFETAGATVNCNAANKIADIDMLRKVPGVVTLKARPRDAIKIDNAGSDVGISSPENNGNPPTPRPVPKSVSKGIVNGSAISLPKPAYPPAAKAVGATGMVNVQVTIDEAGNVVSAVATSGHPLLKPAAVRAAREAKFRPTRLSGVLVKVSGIIVYNFQ